MSLDIRIMRAKKQFCPHCNKEITPLIEETEYSSGRVWYDWLEKIGYYVEYEERTKEKEKDWYGKNMILTNEQKKDLYDFCRIHEPQSYHEICSIIAQAMMEDDIIIINADW